MVCKNCKKDIPEGNKFCTECGTKVGAVPKKEEQVEIVYIEDKKTEQLLSDQIIIPLIFGVFVISILLIMVTGIL